MKFDNDCDVILVLENVTGHWYSWIEVFYNIPDECRKSGAELRNISQAVKLKDICCST